MVPSHSEFKILEFTHEKLGILVNSLKTNDGAGNVSTDFADY